MLAKGLPDAMLLPLLRIQSTPELTTVPQDPRDQPRVCAAWENLAPVSPRQRQQDLAHLRVPNPANVVTRRRALSVDATRIVSTQWGTCALRNSELAVLWPWQDEPLCWAGLQTPKPWTGEPVPTPTPLPLPALPAPWAQTPPPATPRPATLEAALEALGREAYLSCVTPRRRRFAGVGFKWPGASTRYGQALTQLLADGLGPQDPSLALQRRLWWLADAIEVASYVQNFGQLPKGALELLLLPARMFTDGAVGKMERICSQVRQSICKQREDENFKDDGVLLVVLRVQEYLARKRACLVALYPAFHLGDPNVAEDACLAFIEAITLGETPPTTMLPAWVDAEDLYGLVRVHGTQLAQMRHSQASRDHFLLPYPTWRQLILARQAAAITYDALRPMRRPLDPVSRQVPPQPRRPHLQPVLALEGTAGRIYEFRVFMAQWRTNGLEPSRKTPFSLTQLYRIPPRPDTAMAQVLRS